MKKLKPIPTGLLLVALFFTLSCQTPPPPKKEMMEEKYLSSDYFTNIPIDIAIIPVKDQTMEEPVKYVLSYMRRMIYNELLEKRYSVISLGLIDELWMRTPEKVRYDRASIQGAFDEDAILFITLTQWDTQWLRTNSKILTGANLSLVSSKTGEKLWGYNVRDLFFRTAGEVNVRNFDEAQKRIIGQFAKKVTYTLPIKEKQ